MFEQRMVEHGVESAIGKGKVVSTAYSETGVCDAPFLRVRVCKFDLGRTEIQTDRMTVTEWAPGRAMGIEHRGAVTGRGRFTLRRRPRGRTRFTWTERLEFPWWMGGPVGVLAARPVLRAVWRRNLRRLKRLVETGAPLGRAP